MIKWAVDRAKENVYFKSGVGNIEFVRLSSEELTQALSKIREFRRIKRSFNLDSYKFSTVLIRTSKEAGGRN